TLARMQSTMDEIDKQVKVLSIPKVEPPPPQPGDASAVAGNPQPSSNRPTMGATPLYEQARSDYQNARYDLAVQGFTDFLRWYPENTLAPNAQFYIGMVHYTTRNYEQAASDFDAVLEHYNENPKTGDAMLYKGR